MIALLLMIGVLPQASPSRVDLVWGGVAGLAGSVGVGLLYHALAIGTMAVVAPTTAVCAVAIPVMAGVLGGERLAAMTAVGMGLAVAAIVLVSRESNGAPRVRARQLPRGVGIALLSGVAIGLFFLALARTSPAAGMWPLVASRSLSLVLFGVIAVATAQPLRMASPVARLATGGGIVDMAANALYLASTRYGALSVVVTLASLYPASTVILARVILGERLSRWQITGVLCALVAIALIVSGE